MPGHALATEHDQVERAEILLMMAETLTDQSFESVSGDGRLGVLARNGQSQAGAITAVLAGQHGEAVVNGAAGLGEDPVEILTRQQPGAFRKPERGYRQRPRFRPSAAPGPWPAAR